MTQLLFLMSLTILLALFLWRAFTTLPQERWQFIATIPVRRLQSGWQGLNLTYYGFYLATGYAGALIFLIIFLRSLSLSVAGIITVAVLVFISCVPAAKIMARLVEKKHNTFTVGGAFCFGAITLPWLLLLSNSTLGIWLEFHLPVLPVFTVVLIAYAFGESIGRLACISFGCCYGKPLDACSAPIQKIFSRLNFVFQGETKKIAYADHLDTHRVVPVQALTSVIYAIAVLIGIYLFLNGFYYASYFELLAMTQIWRFASEFLRADYRGNGRISAYQIMSLVVILYSLLIIPIFKETDALPANLIVGLQSLWDPGIILFVQITWIAIFLYFGRSRVTASTIGFYVINDRI